MFTQCPECKTIFEITPADLAVAAGTVRCGECSKTFSALKALAETPLEFEPSEPLSVAGDATAEAAAPRDLPDAASDPTPTTAGGDDDEAAVIATTTELARQTGPDGDDAAASDEETVVDDTSRAGDETASASDENDHDSAPDAIPDDPAPDENDHDPAPDEIDHESSDDTVVDEDGDDEIVLDEFYEPDGSDDDKPIDDDEDWDVDDAAEEVADVSEDAQQVDSSALFSLPVPELFASGVAPTAVLPEKLEGGEAAIDPFAQQAHDSAQTVEPDQAQVAAASATPAVMRNNDAVDAEDARDLSDYLRAPRPGRLAAAGWIGGSVLLVLTLFLQIVHQYRGDLVAHPRFGGAVTALYSAVGREVRPNWRVDDYKILGRVRMIEMPASENDEAAPNAWRVVAIIANRADRPQPPPMVRITLRDRWGDPTGVRDFAPPEYLADRSMADQLLEPGQRLRVVLNVLSPQPEIDGFDFDICLPDPRGKLRCAAEPAG